MYGQATALQPHQQVAVGPDSYANFGLSPFAPAPAPLLVHPFDLFAGAFSFPGVDCDPSGRTGAKQTKLARRPSLPLRTSD